MREAFRVTWALIRASWGILRQDRKIMLYTVSSYASISVLIASFVFPLFFNWPYALSPIGSPTGDVLDGIFAASLLLVYVAGYFVAFFFQAAIIAHVRMRLSGDNPTLQDGLRVAGSCAWAILAWSVIAATVGFFLRWIERAWEESGAIVAAVLGTAWSIATFFVVPVLVLEGSGLRHARDRSVRLLKETW